MSVKQRAWLWGFVFVAGVLLSQTVQGAPQTLSHPKDIQEIVSPEGASSQEALSDLTIVVSSCDKYAPLWPAFFQCLFRYWPQLKGDLQHVPIMLIGNKKSFPDPRVTTVLTGTDVSWSDNMLLALSRVKTTYVLYLQDDYLFYQPVDQGRLAQLMMSIKKHAIAYCQLNADGSFRNSPPFAPVPGTLEKGAWLSWHTSLQSAVWRTDVLRYLLKEGEDPWAFEWCGQARRRTIHAPFLCVNKDHPFHFLNAVALGKVRRSNLMFLEQEGLPPQDLAALSKAFPLLDDYESGAEAGTYEFLLAKDCVLKQHIGEKKKKKKGFARFWDHLVRMKF